MGEIEKIKGRIEEIQNLLSTYDMKDLELLTAISTELEEMTAELGDIEDNIAFSVGEGKLKS